LKGFFLRIVQVYNDQLVSVFKGLRAGTPYLLFFNVKIRSILHKCPKQRIHNASKIFSTKNKELTIFGKTINDVKNKFTEFSNAYRSFGLLGKEGAFAALFRSKPPAIMTDELREQFKEFQEQFNHSMLSADALAEKMGNVDASIITYAKTCKNGEMTMKGFEQSLKGVSFSAKAGKAALQALANIGNALVEWLMQAAVAALDNWIHRVERANEAMNQAVSEYETEKSTLESINSELEAHNQRISELQAKGSLTYTEKGELEELQAITKEFLIQQDIAKRNAEAAAKEAAAATVDAYQKQYGKYDISENNLTDALENYDFPHASDQDDVIGNLASYIQSTELLAQAQQDLQDAEKNGENTDWLNDRIEQANNSVTEYSALLNNNIADLEEKLLSMQDAYDIAVENRAQGGLPLSPDEQDAIDTYESIYEALKLIYQYTDQDSWNQMEFADIFSSPDLEKTKDELVEMARSGELTPETLEKYQNLNNAIQESGLLFQDGQTAAQVFCDYINECAKATEELDDSPMSFSDTMEQLSELQSRFESIDQAYSKLFDPDSQIDFEDLSSIFEAFQDLDGIDGYIQRLQEAGQDTEAVTAVIEDLTDSYLQQSGILENVTDENRQLILSMLKEIGIMNAEALVSGSFPGVLQEIGAAKQALGISTNNLNDLTLEEIQRLLEEGHYSEQTRNKLYELYLAQIDLTGNPLDTSASIRQLLGMVDASSAAGIALAQLGSIMDQIGQLRSHMDSTDNPLLKSLDKAAIFALETTAASIKTKAMKEFSQNTAASPRTSHEKKSSSLYNGGSHTQQAISNETEKAQAETAKSVEGSIKEAEEQLEELIDFFDRRNKVLNNSLSLLKSNLENVVGAFAKNKLVDAQLAVSEEKFKNYSDALRMYSQKAGEALSKLPSDVAAKIQDGAVDLTTFVGDGSQEVAEAIRDYENWADKVADCKQELAELRTAIRQLELDKFNHIMDDFQNQFDLRAGGKDLISKQIDLLKEAGQFIGESFFTAQIDQTKKQLSLLEEEKKQLAAQMSSAVGSGKVQKGTEEWLEMVHALSDVEGNILDCKKAIEEFDNELLQLHWDIFERIQSQFHNLDSELSHIISLFQDSKVTDGSSNWTKEGLAQLGLLAQQYELAQYQIQKYNDELNQLSKDYLAGKYSATEYADKLSDLSSAQWEAVSSSESIKDAILDLHEARVKEEVEAIEKEIDAYQELVDAQINALKAAKNLHDYQEQIAEKTKSITDLERQIAAMRNDDTAASVAKRKLLEEELAEAKKELEEAQYDHSIEEQENALNQELENYEEERNAEIERLQASLEEKEQLIAASFETVKQNADLIGQEIARIASEHGITVSNAIISSWQSGEMAIASYGAVLSEQTSAFIGNLMNVEYEVYNLQYQANETANTLAWMFSTRADSLVAELASSYYSEQNLNYMTQALRDSLVKTLESGYNINGLASALDNIAGRLNNVASAAHNAANAIQSVSTAQQSASDSKILYRLEGVAGGTITSYNKSDLEKLAKSYGKGSVVPAYANGGIITKSRSNPLNHIAESIGEDTIIAAKEGESILTKEQTNAVYNLASALQKTSEKGMAFTPEYSNQFMANLSSLSPSMWSWNLPGLPAGQSNAIPNYADRRPNVNVHYDSLVTINGDVNDTKHFLNDMKTVANDAIRKSWHDLDMSRKYGTY